eukprot:scaffold32569_cov112-Isochrysis_galbana.AAC.6
MFISRLFFTARATIRVVILLLIVGGTVGFAAGEIRRHEPCNIHICDHGGPSRLVDERGIPAFVLVIANRWCRVTLSKGVARAFTLAAVARFQHANRV